LAKAIGATYYEFDIDTIVESYKGVVQQALNRELTWDGDDLALQNIQARVRSPGIWMMANISSSLLLSTSNRSEVAVGYATMDGDTSGGLSPIAGVEKTFLRRWLLAMERGEVPGIPALEALRFVNEQPPTAELRPPGAAQEDEKDLMPYEVLDALEAELIAKRHTPLEAFRGLRQQFAGVYPPNQLKQWTHKFCRLFTITQWKRERYAPAFHLDDRNLDPKTWARFPILASAYQAELEELDRETADL
jgi:NAD+ synthase (glutamine-hydrolysing)